MGFVVFSNLGDFNPVLKTYEMVGLFIKDTTKVITPAKPVIDSSRAILKDNEKNFAGSYISDAGVQFGFALKNQKLYWERGGRSDLLVKAEKDTFSVAQAPEVKFVFVRSGKDTLAKQYWPEGDRVLEKYLASDSMQTDKQLQVYTGMYYCPELDCKYGIVLKNHSLVLTNNKYDDTKLTLVGKNDLFNDYWFMSHLKVMRNAENTITGFEVSNGRIMRLRFNKVMK